MVVEDIMINEFNWLFGNCFVHHVLLSRSGSGLTFDLGKSSRYVFFFFLIVSAVQLTSLF